MSRDDIYNALCAIFFQEEIRLMNKISELEYLIRYRGADESFIVELIKYRAILNYFRTYLREVLKFLEYYDK